VPIARKEVGASADRKVIGLQAERLQSRRLRAIPASPWPWPRAVMAIFLLSLLLWAGIATIALLAFD
jgi:hypothetical protein